MTSMTEESRETKTDLHFSARARKIDNTIFHTIYKFWIHAYNRIQGVIA